MDIYLDLSFIANIIVHSLSLFYIYIMFEFKNKIYKNILLVFLLSIIVVSLPFFIIDNIYVYLIYDLLILIALLPNKNKIYMIISYISIYYILIGLAQLFNSGIIVETQMIVINNPVSTLSLILLLIPIIIIYIISFLLKKSFLIFHYKYLVYLKVNDNIYKLKGYLDTGNTLLKDGKPVIFIKNYILQNEKLINEISFKYHTLNNKMRIDIQSVQQLELINNAIDGRKTSSLFAVMNHTVTSNGRKMLIDNILQPPTDQETIEERQLCVEFFLRNKETYYKSLDYLKHLPDLDKIIVSLLQLHRIESIKDSTLLTIMKNIGELYKVLHFSPQFQRLFNQYETLPVILLTMKKVLETT